MLKIPIYSSKKLLLAFEYGLIIADVARDNKVELNPEVVKRAEEMLLNEFHKSPTNISVQMLPNILSIFETK